MVSAMMPFLESITCKIWDNKIFITSKYKENINDRTRAQSDGGGILHFAQKLCCFCVTDQKACATIIHFIISHLSSQCLIWFSLNAVFIYHVTSVILQEMFDASLKDRELSFKSAPGTTMFLHWLVGMVYVFYFASFILLLREVRFWKPACLDLLRFVYD